MRTIFAIAALMLAATTADRAAAQEDAPRAVAVSYADLDLTHAAGRAVLDRRIAMAADKVCAGRPSDVDLARLHVYEACRAYALAGAQQQLAALRDGRKLAQARIRLAAAQR